MQEPRLVFALIADVVNRTAEGKLNIVGEFNLIGTAKMPTRHPVMHLAARVYFPIVAGTEGHTLQIDLVDEDGRKLIPTTEATPIHVGPALPGMGLRADIFAQFVDTVFHRFGPHEVRLIVDGHFIGGATIELEQLPPE